MHIEDKINTVRLKFSSFLTFISLAVFVYLVFSVLSKRIDLFMTVLFFGFVVFQIYHFRKDKISYDINGITLSLFMGKRCFVPWYDVITIEESAHNSKFNFYSRRITYNGITRTVIPKRIVIEYRFGGREYFMYYRMAIFKGLPELLDFYNNLPDRDQYD